MAKAKMPAMISACTTKAEMNNEFKNNPGLVDTWRTVEALVACIVRMRRLKIALLNMRMRDVESLAERRARQGGGTIERENVQRHLIIDLDVRR